MPDPTMPDNELDHLTRAYLHRRRGRPAPPDLEANTVSFVLSRRRTRSLGALLTSPVLAGATTLLLVSGALTGALLLHHPAPSGSAGPPPLQKSPAPTHMPTSSPTHAPSSPSPSPSFLPLVGPACTASDLALRLGIEGGVGGDGITRVVVTDRGSSPCVLEGTPQVDLLDSQGRKLSSPEVVKSTGGQISPIPNHGVGLIPTSEGASGATAIQGQAVLPLQYVNGCISPVAAVRVTFAGGSFTLPLKISPEGTQAGGACSVVYVNPLQPPSQ